MGRTGLRAGAKHRACFEGEAETQGRVRVRAKQRLARDSAHGGMHRSVKAECPTHAVGVISTLDTVINARPIPTSHTTALI